MTRNLHCRATTFLSTFVVAAGLMAGTAMASAPSHNAPPPPPDEGTAPQGLPQVDPIAQFRQTLERYGSFHTHALYGQVWKPSEQIAPPGWSPYPVCHWQFDREQRTWVFADPTEWGAIVHHHGRWANDPQFGWIWVGDTNAGPGWVIWRNEARTVSWAPMLPEQHGNQPPREGWQTQDQASFNGGCRGAAPQPLQVERRAMVNPAPMPMMVPGGSGYGSGGAVFVPGRPVFVPDRPIFIPGRPPMVGGGLPPSCSTGIRPSWCRPVCATRPFTPGCRPSGPVVGGRPFPGRVTPGPLGSICARFPASPACRPAHRPHHFGQLHNRPFHPPHVVSRPHQHRPFAGRFTGGQRFGMGQRFHSPRFSMGHRSAGPRMSMGHGGHRFARR